MRFPLVRLADCCSVVSGATPRTGVAEYWGGDIPWVTPKDIANLNSPVLMDSPVKITKLGFDSCSTQIIPAGAVLLSSRAPIGHLAIAGRDMCTNQGFKSLVPSEKVDSGYLYHCMKFMVPRLAALGNGATFKEVSKSIVENFAIPLPDDIVVQRRIAARLDKAAAIHKKRREALELVDKFIRSVFLDMFGDPISNPKGWPELVLGEIAERIQIGPFGTQLHQEDYIEGGIPLVNPTHIVGGRIVPNNSLSVSIAKHEALAEYHLDVGDVLMGRRGEMGRCAVVGDAEKGFLCGTGSLFIRPNFKKILPGYLYRVLSSDSAKAVFERASQGATMPNLNKRIVGDFKIGVAPLSLQKQFVETELRCENLRNRQSLMLEESRLLLQSLQYQAFA